jgi:Flp pilus assembly protein TadG
VALPRLAGEFTRICEHFEMNLHCSKRPRGDRRGNVIVLTAFFMTVMVAFVALGVDLGFLQNARVELQTSADSSAMAAAAELTYYDESLMSQEALPQDIVDYLEAARDRAVQYAALNQVCKSAPVVDPNLSNSHSGDIVIGYLAHGADPEGPLDTTDSQKFNAVQIRVRRVSSQNGEVPMFFGKTLGLSSVATEGIATAVIEKNVKGFRTPDDNETINVLPYAIDLDTWNNLINSGVGSDTWRWDESTGTVVLGSDSIKEINLFPQGSGWARKRGTVDIGSNSNTTADLARQIVQGINKQDMLDLGKALEFDGSGKLTLNGDMGISTGVKDQLASIIGKTRIIPIFESVSGTGNNCTYTIVQWAGVRVLDVKLTGGKSSKRLTIQPATVVSKYASPNPDSTPTSWFVYTPPKLVR